MIGCVAGTYLTEPEPDEVLIDFYMRVRPWGFWKPVLRKVHQRYPHFQPNRRFGRDMFNVAVGVAWQTSLVALPIFLVIREMTPAYVTLAVLVATSLTLKISWWNTLDDASRDDDALALHEAQRAPEAAVPAAEAAT